MSYTDEELFDMTVRLLRMPTARDKQKRIGASNLSNGCDYCLACNLLGDDRQTARSDQAWFGRVLGTAFHAILEHRITDTLAFDELEGEALRVAREQISTMLSLDPDARAEVPVIVAEILGYGEVPGTIDVEFPEQIVDWKGSTRKKICILIDYMQEWRGLPPIFGRTNTWVKLSEKEYAAEMLKMAYKVTGYYGQATLYMKGAGKNRASLIFLARDGTGFYDSPASAKYRDKTVVHDVHVLSFDYDPAYAASLIARGQAIWDHLQAGGTPADLARHEMCYPCAEEAKAAAKAEAVLPAIETTLAVAA